MWFETVIEPLNRKLHQDQLQRMFDTFLDEVDRVDPTAEKGLQAVINKHSGAGVELPMEDHEGVRKLKLD